MTIAYVIGQGNLTVNQFEENKNICIPYYDEDVPTKISFIIGKNTDTNKDITMDVLGHLRTPNESSKFHVFPIPNQLLNGEFCGEVHFTHSIWDFGTWIEYSESPYILTINKADRPSDYECAPTPLLNDYNAEVVIDTSKSPCLQFKSIDTNKLYTGKGGGRNLYINMFNDCESLTSLDLSSFNTSLVTNMNRMFFGCGSLTSLDLSSFNTSACTDMGYMFYNCESLTSLDLSSFNTSLVTNMSSMFFGCASLTSLDLSSFNTSLVTNMNRMFFGCGSLTSLDLSSFNTSLVTNMDNMFFGCDALTSLDLSSFNTQNVKSMTRMIDCYRLTNLTLGQNWGINDKLTALTIWGSNITHDSCLDVFNKLADKTQTATTSATLRLSISTKERMSSTEIAIATNKGWTIINTYA